MTNTPHLTVRRFMLRKKALLTTVGAAVLAGGLAVGWAACRAEDLTTGLLIATLYGVVILLVAIAGLSVGLAKVYLQLNGRLTAHRKAASRHEWLQEAALDRLEDQAFTHRSHLITAEIEQSVPVFSHCNIPDAPRMLFITSNGGGLGHLTRCVALVDTGRDFFHATIVSMCQAAQQLSATRPYLTYFPCADGYPDRRHAWSTALFDRLVSTIHRGEIDVVVFDGVAIYDAVQRATAATGVPLVWMRRGMWKDSAAAAEVDTRRVAAVIVPGEYGQELAVQHNTVVTAPIIVDAGSSMSRRQARRALGLDEDGVFCLVQTGRASVDGIDDLHAAIVAGLDDSVTPVILDNPLAPVGPTPPGAPVIRHYPLGALWAAFDYAVTACGYNTVAEALYHQVPTLLIPYRGTSMDDQVARARATAALAGWDVVYTAADLAPGLSRLTGDASLGQQLSQLTPRSGNEQAARAIVGCVRVPGDVTLRPFFTTPSPSEHS